MTRFELAIAVRPRGGRIAFGRRVDASTLRVVLGEFALQLHIEG